MRPRVSSVRACGGVGVPWSLALACMLSFQLSEVESSGLHRD